MQKPLRVGLFTMILPAAVGIDAIVRQAGHEAVALFVPRPRPHEAQQRRERRRELVENAPAHLDVCLASDPASLAPLLGAYDLDVVVCAGYPWRIPADALSVPRLGVVNGHPSLLPRHRGPYPLSWAVREGDTELGMTFHLMDEDFDTGPILTQGVRPMPADCSFDSLQPLLAELALELLPPALDRLASGDRGTPQTEAEATYAGPFGEDFRDVDLTGRAADVQRQVEAWQLMFAAAPLDAGPLVELDGRRVRLLRTTLEEPEKPSLQLDARDRPIWVLEHEPAES